MQVKVVSIDKDEEVVALVATQFKGEFPKVYDPVGIANLLGYVQNGGELDDECLEALRVAEAVLLNISDIFITATPSVTAVTLGEPESLEDVEVK